MGKHIIKEEKEFFNEYLKEIEVILDKIKAIKKEIIEIEKASLLGEFTFEQEIEIIKKLKEELIKSKEPLPELYRLSALRALDEFGMTITGYPDDFSPVYNPIYFYIDSVNKNLPGFKYIADIFDNGTLNRIGRYSLFPRPVDGFGIVDINQLLATQVSYFYPDNISTPFYRCPENFYLYDMQFGEEYFYFWDFTESFSSTGGNVGFQGSVAHNYIIGDQITIQQIAGATNPEYDGVHIITDITTDTITIDVPVGTPVVESGTTAYSDHRKIQVLDIIESPGNGVFNGAVSHKKYRLWDSNEYIINETYPGDWLTNIPDNYRIKYQYSNRGNEMWFNLYSDKTNVYVLYLLVQTDFGEYVIDNPYTTSGDTMLTVGVGPINIASQTPTVISGTLPIFKNTTWEFYDNGFGYFGNVQFLGTTPHPFSVGDIVNISQFAGATYSVYNGLHTITDVTTNAFTIDVVFAGSTPPQGGLITQITNHYDVSITDLDSEIPPSKAKRIQIDYNCIDRYENIELYFYDRLGSLIPANFELQSARSINIDRNEYQSILGYKGENPVTGAPSWTYDSTNRGRHSINTKVVQVLDIQSNWITEEESIFLQELYSSPVVFIKDPIDHLMWPVIVKTNSYAITTKNNKKLFNLKMTIEYANQDRVQDFG